MYYFFPPQLDNSTFLCRTKIVIEVHPLQQKANLLGRRVTICIIFGKYNYMDKSPKLFQASFVANVFVAVAGVVQNAVNVWRKTNTCENACVVQLF